MKFKKRFARDVMMMLREELIYFKIIENIKFFFKKKKD